MEQTPKAQRSKAAPAPVQTDQVGRGRAALLLSLLLGLLLVRHLWAHQGDAGLEHFEELMSQLLRYSSGWLGLGPQRGGGVTGGGQLFFLLHEALRRAGLSFGSVQAMHLALEAAALLSWLVLAPRSFSPPLVWSVALALTLYDVPKLHLMENSTLVALSAVPLFALLVRLLERWRWRLAVAAALLMALSVNLGVIALSIVPAVVMAAWIRRYPRRWWLLVLLALAAGLALLPLLLAPFQGAGLSRDVLDAARSMGWAGAATSVGSTLGRFLWDAPLLLGLLAIMRRCPPPWLALVLLWLAWTILPISLIDLGDQGELFHFAAASPARAMVAGAGILWGTRLLARLSRGRLSWSSVLVGATLGCLVATAAPLVSRAGEAPDQWRGSPAEGRCTASDSGACGQWQIRRLLADLARAGVTPAAAREVTFHGAYAPCLNGAWRWNRSQAAGGRQPDAEATHILLITPTAGLDAASLPGARQVGKIVAIKGVRPLEVRVVRGRPGGNLNLDVSGLGDDLALLVLDSAMPLPKPKISLLDGGAQVLAAAGCADVHAAGTLAVLRTGALAVIRGAGAQSARVRTDIPDQSVDAVHGVLIPAAGATD